MSANQRPLWKCPKCGHRFVSKNLYHSCGRYRIAEHFVGKAPQVRAVFDRFSRMVRACGPATIYAQKTRIVFQVRVRFAGAIARNQWLQISLWLTERQAHPKLHKIDKVAPRCFVHNFRFHDPGELDDAFTELLANAYAVGRQEHLR